MSPAQLALFENIPAPRIYNTQEDRSLEDHLGGIVICDEQQEHTSLEKEQKIVLAFNPDVFEKPPEPSKETMQSIYLGNLTRDLFVFYGGKPHLLAAYESPADWREQGKIGKNGDFERNTDGTVVTQQYRVREHYPENPPLSVAACRELATRIIDADKYKEVTCLCQRVSYSESSRSRVDELCEDYGTRPDSRGKVHEELFTFYLMRLPLLALLKNEEERHIKKPFRWNTSAPDSQRVREKNEVHYCVDPSTNPKTALCALRRS